jgi:mono/diheme cytochrome c family protein
VNAACSGYVNFEHLMNLIRFTLLPVLAFGLASSTAAAAPLERQSDEFPAQIRPLLNEYCAKCHGSVKAKAGVNLAVFTNTISVYRDPKMWEAVAAKLQAGEMPPEGKPQPSTAERENLIHWVQKTLLNLEEGRFAADPGRVMIHRLSRTEYNCTIRDLLGIDTKPADTFPSEGGGGGGFDNNADTLFIPPLLMERYLATANAVLDQAPQERIFYIKKGLFQSERGAAKKIVEHFAFLGFRRPVEAREIDRLMLVYEHSRKQGASFETATKAVLSGILASPNFLFRVESNQENDQPYRINDYELASRISYFLWSSMPDEELFRLAGQNRLHDPKILQAQVERMIRDPKSEVFAESFASQWLRVRELKTAAQPDPQRFPNYTPALRDAMYREVIAFFDSVVRENRNLLILLAADYTFLNSDLATLYGIDGIQGEQLRKVKLTDTKRSGILGMAAVLTLTSYPQRTSPVLRGKWVLEEILGTPPPPPPPLVKSLPPDDAPVEGLTLRQRLEKHREQPECAACHLRMDPLGFGLENFDPIGRWRTQIGEQAVDASGVLPGGQKFEGPVELRKILLNRKQEFIRNVTQKMLAYGLGRGLEYYDTPSVNEIEKALADNDYRSSVLITEIVKSFPFQFRRNAPVEQATNNRKP